MRRSVGAALAVQLLGADTAYAEQDQLMDETTTAAAYEQGGQLYSVGIPMLIRRIASASDAVTGTPRGD